MLKAGVALNDVNTTLGALLGSSYINDFNRFGRVYKVYLQAEPEFRRDASQLGLFYVRSQAGGMVPLDTLVSTRPSAGPEFTNRFNLFRTAEVTGVPAAGYSSTQALNALAGMIYLSWLGREGLVELCELLVSRTHYARETLAAIDGVELWHDQPVVREFALKLNKDVLEVLEFCAERGVNAGYPLADNGLLVAITEQRSKADIDRLAEVLTEALA